jgi:hypothetical protein
VIDMADSGNPFEIFPRHLLADLIARRRHQIDQLLDRIEAGELSPSGLTLMGWLVLDLDRATEAKRYLVG